MKNKIIIISFLFITILIMCLFRYIDKDKFIFNAKPTVIWYIPHPDDETIFMGGSINKYVTEGYNNILILFTKGGKSLAIYKINEKLKGKLTNAEFRGARVSEFLAATSHLGINKKDIIIYDFPDGDLKQYKDKIYKLILAIENKYPSAIHNSMSYHDKHMDHNTIGEALLKAYNEGYISNAIFYLNNSEFKLKGSFIQFTSEMRIAKIEALTEYKYYNPKEYRYAIGYTSVPKTIDNQIMNPKEKIHKANE